MVPWKNGSVTHIVACIWDTLSVLSMLPQVSSPVIFLKSYHGEKFSWKTNHPPGKKIPGRHLCTAPLFLLFFPLNHSLPIPQASLSFMSEPSSSDLLPPVWSPGPSWPHLSQWGPWTVELSLWVILPLILPQPSTMHTLSISRKLIYYVMPS